MSIEIANESGVEVDTDAILDEPAPADGGDPASGPDDRGPTATGKNV